MKICKIIKAKNQTTQFTYYWCETHKIVRKDFEGNGFERCHENQTSKLKK